mgnify:CR=1 FL=1
MEKTFDPHDIEIQRYEQWERSGVFRPSGSGPPYCIMLPPPNVTGSLHMGHALNSTLQDILIRWKRMQGFNTLWVPGTDHAGIATQHVVEKDLWNEEKKALFHSEVQKPKQDRISPYFLAKKLLEI